jgi:hypothetical protein
VVCGEAFDEGWRKLSSLVARSLLGSNADEFASRFGVFRLPGAGLRHHP